MIPQRLQLSRRKGFDLQALSHALNGLPARIVARPGAGGNPFKWQEIVRETGTDGAAAQAVAVAHHAAWMLRQRAAPDGRAPPDISLVQRELAGHNLACWCKLGTPCHAELLLELANR